MAVQKVDTATKKKVHIYYNTATTHKRFCQLLRLPEMVSHDAAQQAHNAVGDDTALFRHAVFDRIHNNPTWQVTIIALFPRIASIPLNARIQHPADQLFPCLISSPIKSMCARTERQSTDLDKIFSTTQHSVSLATNVVFEKIRP